MKVEVIGPPGQTVEGEGGGVEGEGEKGGGVGHTPPSKEFGSMELEWKASHSQLELGEDGKGGGRRGRGTWSGGRWRETRRCTTTAGSPPL